MMAAVCVMLGVLYHDLIWYYYGQPSAVLWKDQLFVAINGKTLSASGSLYRNKVWLDWAGIEKPLEYRNPTGTSHAYQAKLEIRDNRVLLASPGEGYCILPLADVPGLEVSEFGEQLCVLRGFKSQSHFVDSYSLNDTYAPLLFPSHRAPDVPTPNTPVDPITARVAEQAWEQRRRDYAAQARTAVEVVGPNTVRLFHVHKATLFVSVELDYLNRWYLDGKANVSKNLPKPPERELRTGTLPADFTEHFSAYRVGGRDYLLTPSGMLYMVSPREKAEVEVSAVWADPKRRLVGIVQDTANDAVYGWGFVTDSAAPERFYVKLGPKPVAVAYTRTVPLWGDRSDAYLESYECARAFRAAGGKK